MHGSWVAACSHLMLCCSQSLSLDSRSRSLSTHRISLDLLSLSLSLDLLSHSRKRSSFWCSETPASQARQVLPRNRGSRTSAHLVAALRCTARPTADRQYRARGIQASRAKHFRRGGPVIEGKLRHNSSRFDNTHQTINPWRGYAPGVGKHIRSGTSFASELIALGVGDWHFN